MRFRRSFRLKITPLVFLVLVALAWLYPKSVVIVGSIFAAATWVLLAQSQAAKSLEIDIDTISMHGYLGSPTVISKQNVASCRYFTARRQGRGAYDFFFVEIEGQDGRRLKVWRYGWGRRRHELFPALNEWLRGSGVAVDERVQRFLSSAA